MFAITLLSVGSLKKSWCKDGCEDYISRLNHSCNFKVVELPASKQKDPSKQKEEESKSILDRLEKTEGTIFVLDEIGKELESEEFSKVISNNKDKGDSIIFVIGGAYGLNNEVREFGDRVISLSKMTLPHELCRVLFLEQLYRAMEILKGSGYHH
ncbi:MAG: 23S rRNA (pseudouridine(1915)-N(3))-methyltransferase RlmH [Candidatus Peribacteraceae bacterium]|nr:23S rRNA (pseudouridine(1915)-N(3))-methyltransferase RlmH [Candidatus Peribacteraceae bacterium]